MSATLDWDRSPTPRIHWRRLRHCTRATSTLLQLATAGVPAARRRIEELIRRLAKTIVRRMGGGEGQAADTASEVVEKLLVGSETRSARIDAYGGRSSLQGWIRATLSRAYLNPTTKAQARGPNRRRKAPSRPCVTRRLIRAWHSFKSQYRVQFSAAFEAATQPTHTTPANPPSLSLCRWSDSRCDRRCVSRTSRNLSPVG